MTWVFIPNHFDLCGFSSPPLGAGRFIENANGYAASDEGQSFMPISPSPKAMVLGGMWWAANILLAQLSLSEAASSAFTNQDIAATTALVVCVGRIHGGI
jgi:hypothetical protein